MIISHKYKFIFIHCRKVAGSSIKIALAPYLGEKDIIIGSYPEIIENNIKVNEKTQKILNMPLSKFFIYAGMLLGKKKASSKNYAIKYQHRYLGKNPPHPTALRISTNFPYEWNNYFKFAFVRNPYERVVSDYYWRKKSVKREFTFREYLENLKYYKNKNRKNKKIIHANATSNWDMISIDDRIQMDYIGKYENLQEDFNTIMNKLQLPLNKLDIIAKPGSNRNKYSELYGEYEKEMVKELFAKEIEEFGYEYPYK